LIAVVMEKSLPALRGTPSVSTSFFLVPSKHRVEPLPARMPSATDRDLERTVVDLLSQHHPRQAGSRSNIPHGDLVHRIVRCLLRDSLDVAVLVEAQAVGEGRIRLEPAGVHQGLQVCGWKHASCLRQRVEALIALKQVGQWCTF